MKPAPFIIDNSVLSAFYRQDWMGLLELHPPERTVLVPKVVWTDEFTEEFEREDRPGYIEMRESPPYPAIEEAKSLSDPDLACLAITSKSGGAVVTNDKVMIETADKLDLSRYWGTEFLIRSFEQCGVTQDEFDSGLSGYIDDIYISKEVEQQLYQAEKP